MKTTGGFSLAIVQALHLSAACATTSKPAVNQSQPVVQRSVEFDAAELREHVQALLSEPSARPEDWKRLGPGALAVLEQTVRNSKAPAPQRGRALEALALIDGEEAAAKLRAIAQDRKVGAQYRSGAVVAVAERDGRAAAQQLSPVLCDPNRQLREQAVRSLANLTGPEARAALEERLPREEDPALRELIQRSLARMQP
jgi:HEAT repeat protein